MSEIGDRYDGRPFVRLLDAFVLWAIGELPTSQYEQLADLTPKLQSTYGSDGDWTHIVMEQMAFPDDLPAALRAMWDRNTELASSAGQTLDPAEFARHLVDANFV